MNSLMQKSKRSVIHYKGLLALQITRTLLLIPYVLGFIAGYFVLCIRYSWAALVEGYNAGNNNRQL